MDEGGGFVKSWVLKRISNIQHQCPMSKFEDEGKGEKLSVTSVPSVADFSGF